MRTRMLADSALDDVSDVLERRSELLQLVVAQRNVVRQIRFVSDDLIGRRELVARLFESSFLKYNYSLNAGVNRAGELLQN